MSGDTRARAPWGAPLTAFFVLVGGIYAILGIYFLLLTVDRIWPIAPLKPILHPEQANMQITPFPMPKVEEAYELTRISSAPGATSSGEGLFELDRVQIVGGAVFPNGPRATVNILSIDAKNRAAHWLFAGHDRTIQSISPLFDNAMGDAKSGLNLLGVAMVVANRQGSGPVALYVYRMDGKEPEKVLTADQISIMWSFGDPKVRVLSQTGTTTVAAIYSVPDFKLLAQVPVAGMPKMAPPTSGDATSYGATALSLLVDH